MFWGTKLTRGYIKLHRVLLESWVTDLKPAYFKVAITLLLKANWKPSKSIFKGEKFQIERGQVATSLDGLVKSCPGVTKNQVRSALNLLEKVEFLRIETTRKFTYLTILNYELYQGREEDESHGNHTGITREAHGRHTTSTPIEEGKKERKGRKEEGSSSSDESVEGQNLFLFPIPAAKPKPKPKPKKSEVDPKRFELAYQYYPRKVGKAKGIKLAQANILTEDEFTAFGKALVTLDKTWADATEEDKKFLPHFDTFVRNERWKEELPTPERNRNLRKMPPPIPLAPQVTGPSETRDEFEARIAREQESA